MALELALVYIGSCLRLDALNFFTLGCSQFGVLEQLTKPNLLHFPHFFSSNHWFSRIFLLSDLF